jgi:hypothetical protein
MCCGGPEACASRRWRWSSLRERMKRCVGGFTSCCSLRLGAGRGWWSSTTRAGRRRAGEGRARVADGRVSVGAWADHHHDAGGRVGAAGGGLSGSERDRSATLRLVRRGLAHDAKVWQVSAGLTTARSTVKRPCGANTKSCAACACPSVTWKT